MTKTIKNLTNEESSQLINYVSRLEPTDPHHKRGVRTKTLFLLMLDAGLRVGEAVQLPIASLELFGEPTKNVRVPPAAAKNHVERYVPMTERLTAAVRHMIRYWWAPDKMEPHRPAFYIIPTGGHITARQVQRILEATSWAAFGRKVNPHALRHTFASRLMRQTNIRVVQQLLGHKSLTSTQIYTHPNSTDLKLAIDKLNGTDA